eukprot:2293268-Rhodomonas_salina.2
MNLLPKPGGLEKHQDTVAQTGIACKAKPRTATTPVRNVDYVSCRSGVWLSGACAVHCARHTGGDDSRRWRVAGVMYGVGQQ